MTRTVVLLALFVPVVFFSTAPGVMGASPQDQLEKAESAVDNKEYTIAIEQLKSILQMTLETDAFAKANFLMGRAMYEKAIAVVNASRPDGKVIMGDISPLEVQELKRSVDYFKAVIDAMPDGELAPDAYFMLGKLFDYDCLQHFKESKDYYSKVYEMGPDTKTGTQAKECIDRIDGYSVHHPK